MEAKLREEEVDQQVLAKLKKEKVQVQAAYYYLSTLPVTFWGDWTISSQVQRLAAARWLAHASSQVAKVRRNGNFKPY